MTDHLFNKGVSGNPKGRPKGSKNKLSEFFLRDMVAAWESNGVSVINDVIREKPDVFLRVVASLVPKEMNLNVTNDVEAMTDDEIRTELAEIADALANVGVIATGGSSSGGSKKSQVN